MSKPWRDAASMIVVARDATKNSKFDYKVLTFKRAEKTSFYANSLAFPGGSIDKSDETLNWLNYFKNHKIPSEEIRKKYGVKKPLIYDFQSNKIEREISLRIAAIRETFEELGIVLCSPKNEHQSNSTFSSYFHSKDCDIPTWQHKIHNNEETLLGFCEKFNLVPNILSVFEWSVWLTPTFYPKRFETAFFIVALNSIPPVYGESNEVQDYSWHTPDDLISMHLQQTASLPPPQFYELHRLRNYSNIDELAKISQLRNGQDIPLVLPINFFLKDTLMLVYPGDDLYPENPNLYEATHDLQKYSDKTFDEMKKICINFCRIELKNMMATNFMCNTVDTFPSAMSDEFKGKL